MLKGPLLFPRFYIYWVYVKVDVRYYIYGVRTKRRKSSKTLKVEYLINEYCFTKYGLLHFLRKWAMSTTI